MIQEQVRKYVENVRETDMIQKQRKRTTWKHNFIRFSDIILCVISEF